MQLHEIITQEQSKQISSPSERARLLCSVAKGHEDAGDYDAARAALEEFWPRLGERPRLEGLDDPIQAELLLRAGTLSGWLGRAKQIEGAQGIAKDLISESGRIFDRLGLVEKRADAQIDLAVCYWREGALDESRVTLREVLSTLGEAKSEQRLRALANLALLETSATRYKDALRIQTEAAPLFAESSNHALRGNFHNAYGQVLKNLGLAEKREEYIDRALIEYTAASFHFEHAGHKRFQAAVENNIGFLLSHLKRFDEAQKCLKRARSLAQSLQDQGLLAQIDDTRAKAFLAEGRIEEAEATARTCARSLESGDEQSLLAEALITHGTALARLGRNEDGGSALARAMKVAEQAGDPESGGVAALTIIEELGSIVPPVDLRECYRKAETNLALSQHPGIDLRLGACARLILAAENHPNLSLQVAVETPGNGAEVKGTESSVSQAQGSTSAASARVDSLDELVLRYEGDLIRRALEATGGSVTRAARLLGITHQGLAFILNGRHRNLLAIRKPVKPRRRSIIRYRN